MLSAQILGDVGPFSQLGASCIRFGGKQNTSLVTNKVDPPDLEHHMPEALRLLFLLLLLLLLRSDTPAPVVAQEPSLHRMLPSYEERSSAN